MITVSQVDRCRLDIGHFELETVGTILTGSMRINLFDANVTGHLTTTDGSVSFTTMTMSSEHLFVIDIETEGKESGLDLRYVPEHGICNGRYLPDDYVKNPLPECSTVYSRRTYQVCQHRLLVEGDYAKPILSIVRSSRSSSMQQLTTQYQQIIFVIFQPRPTVFGCWSAF